MAETRFEKDKEKKDIYKHYLTIMVALIISTTGGLASVLTHNEELTKTENIILLAGGVFLILFVLIFLKVFISLYRLKNKFD